MPKRIVSFLDGMPIPPNIYEMRQGLPPNVVDGIYPAYNVNGNKTFALTPDQLTLVQTNTTSGTNAFFIYNDAANLGNRVVPAATFAGNVNTCAASNNHIVIIGTSDPFMYVFDRYTLALLSVPVVAFSGTYPRSVAFSPDGSRMAVGCHNGTVVVFNTADWSTTVFPNNTTALGAGAGTKYAVGFSQDGKRMLAVTGSGNPIYAVFELVGTTWSRIAAVNNSNLGIYGGNSPMACNPQDPDEFIWAMASASSYGSFCRLNLRTLAQSLSTTKSVTPSSLLMDPDPAEDSMYVMCSVWTGTAADQGAPTQSTILKYRISTLELHPDNKTDAYANFFRTRMASGAGPSSCWAFVNTTPYELTGTVRDINNAPAARTVRAIRRSNGVITAQTVSDATTGNYRLKLSDPGPFDVQFMAADGELLNDIVFAKSEPKPL